MIKRHLEVGTQEIFSYSLPGSRPLHICYVTDDQYVVCTARNLYHFLGKQTFDVYPYQFAICEYIEQHNVIVGVEINSPSITVLLMRKGFPSIFRDFRLPSPTVFQILFSYETNTLVLVGTEIYFFDFTCVLKKFAEYPELEIKYRMKYEYSASSIANFRVFPDHSYKRFLIPTNSGYSIMSFEGKMIKNEPNLNASLNRTVAVLFSPKKAAVSSPELLLEPFKSFLVTDTAGESDFSIVLEPI